MGNLKKIILTIVLIIIIFSVQVPANSATYSFNFNLMKCSFSDTFGKVFSLPHMPIVKDGNYLVPLRAVVESAGGNVRYFSKTHDISLKYGTNRGFLSIGCKEGYVSNKKYFFKIQPFIIRGRTMVSVIFIANLLNGSVYINGNACEINFYKLLMVKDVLNNKITLYSEPKRIISLAPNLTEILFAIGAGSKIVGVSNYSNYPDEVNRKPKVGGFFNPSIEKIFALSPDVVVVARGTPLTVINKLKNLGIKVYASDPHSIEDIYNLISTMGYITGNVTESKNLVNMLRSEENEIIQEVKGIPHSQRKKVYVEIWNNPKMSVGKGTFINALIKKAGGINIVKNAKGDWPVMSDEAIVKANPDVIILLYNGNVNDIKKRPGWEDIKAVKTNQIFVENPDIFERPGPRIMQSLELLFNILYGKIGG